MGNKRTLYERVLWFVPHDDSSIEIGVDEMTGELKGEKPKEKIYKIT